MMTMASSPLGMTNTSGSLPDLQNVATPQSITAADPWLQLAVSAQPPFTLSMLSVMPTVPNDDAGLDAVGPTRPAPEEHGGAEANAEAPVMLLQQILDGLLASNTSSFTPAAPAADVRNDAGRLIPAGEALISPSSLPDVSLPTQGHPPALADAGALLPVQQMVAKKGEFSTPLTVLNAAENRVISTVQPEIQPQSVGCETKSSPATLRLEPESSRWAQQLQSALGERLQVQVKDQIQHATIRLDPPEMGKIDIAVQIENGRVQVTINANQGEVYRALQQVSNDLRQSLTEQNFVQVNVQVSSQNGQRDGQQQSAPQKQPEKVMAAVSLETDASMRREDASVLLTV